MDLLPTRTARRVAAIAAVLALVVAILLVWRPRSRRPEAIGPGKFPEQLVYVRSQDDIVSGGVLFSPPADSAKQIGIIWIHGWGVNFYQPAYVAIGRALAESGYACIVGNTRMHDLGNVAGRQGNQRVRGGGYWGVASGEVRDIAAWADLAEQRGFGRIVLVGHSAGAAAVRRYQAETQDARVVGIVLASGSIAVDQPMDQAQVAEANRLLAAGESEALVRDPKRSFPSYISAATLLDIANAAPEYKDFFGIQPTTGNPAVTRVGCPLLAFFGTRGDVGDEKDLERLKSCLRRLARGPSRVDTTMIPGADHMYAGQEKQVADMIARWVDSLRKK